MENRVVSEMYSEESLGEEQEMPEELYLDSDKDDFVVSYPVKEKNDFKIDFGFQHGHGCGL